MPNPRAHMWPLAFALATCTTLLMPSISPLVILLSNQHRTPSQ